MDFFQPGPSSRLPCLLHYFQGRRRRIGHLPGGKKAADVPGNLRAHFSSNKGGDGLKILRTVIDTRDDQGGDLHVDSGPVHGLQGIHDASSRSAAILPVSLIVAALVAPLLQQLEEVLNSGTVGTVDYASWPLDLLIDYIIKKHHRYVAQKSAEIKPFLAKIADVHGDRHPELLEVEQLFQGAVGALTLHMQKEELVLFPDRKSVV